LFGYVASDIWVRNTSFHNCTAAHSAGLLGAYSSVGFQVTDVAFNRTTVTYVRPSP
jgi:hypothetical protein